MTEQIKQVCSLLQAAQKDWKPPTLPQKAADMPQGDMPGDAVHISEAHRTKADAIFPLLLPQLAEICARNPYGRAVITVCGGSGSGKTGAAALLGYYFKQIGIGSYVLSGDNYPRRYPALNDAERLRIFRQGGMHGLTSGALLTPDVWQQLHTWQIEQRDADPTLCADVPWLAVYQAEGRKALAGYGASIVRLDAFAYAPKEPGEKNFLNDPATWELLDKVKVLADEYGLQLLPEIHASYSEKIYQTVADKGYMTYDFFLPGLVLDAIENKDGSYLAAWADELRDHQIHTVNMLGCHDGIPLLDLKGLLPEERIQSLIGTIVARGGMVKDLHGQKNIYYQVNATYYSALGADDDKMLLARAIQLFMPGKPQVWYLDLFAGKNDVEAVRHAGAGGHKEINRTNLNAEQINTALQRDVVQRQLDLLRLRKTHPAFHSDAEITTTWSAPVLSICWKHGADMIALRADLVKDKFEIQ